jgi:hypothetical protein
LNPPLPPYLREEEVPLRQVGHADALVVISIVVYLTVLLGSK